MCTIVLCHSTTFDGPSSAIEYLARVNEATAALAAFQTTSTGIGVQGSPEEPHLVQNSTLLPNAEVSMKTAVPKKKGKQKKSNVLDSNGVNTTKKSSAQAPVPFKSEAQVPKKPLRLDLQAIFKEFQGCDSLEGKMSNLGPTYRIFIRSLIQEEP